MVKKRQKYSRKRRNRRSEKQTVVFLPNDIISTILSKQPAESILSCRIVCKSWYALTHDPFFIRNQLDWSKHHEPLRYILQLRHASHFQSLYLLDINKQMLSEISFKKMNLPPYPYRYKLSGYNIVGSSNGLLCLTPKACLDAVIICNPITRDCLILPYSAKGIVRPLKSYQLGFHFDSSSGKYKIIREFQFFDDQRSNFELITLGEHSWKKINYPLNYEIEKGFNAAPFWNDAFHWKLSETHSRHDKNCILSFDLVEDKFFIISFDSEKYNVPCNYKLVILGGELKMVEHERYRFLKIWRVTGNKVNGYSILLQYTYVLCVPPRRMWHHDLVSEIGEEIYLMQVTKWEKGARKTILEMFCPRIGVCQELDIKGLPTLFKIACYRPSLVSPLS